MKKSNSGVSKKKKISKLESFEVLRFEQTRKIIGGTGNNDSAQCGGGDTTIPTSPPPGGG